jgi:hypothetical protein
MTVDEAVAGHVQSLVPHLASDFFIHRREHRRAYIGRVFDCRRKNCRRARLLEQSNHGRSIHKGFRGDRGTKHRVTLRLLLAGTSRPSDKLLSGW